MASPSPSQIAWRNRLETVLRLIEPGLNLMLAAGDRLSRVVDRDALDSPPPARRVERAPLVHVAPGMHADQLSE